MLHRPPEFTPVVWNIASHHPDRCHAVASLCVPYYSLERGLDHTLALVDRELYPEDEYPAGQWDYMRFYEESFDEAIAPMDENVAALIKLAFRKGYPAGEGKPAMTSTARRDGGIVAGGQFPDLPRDGDVVTDSLFDLPDISHDLRLDLGRHAVPLLRRSLESESEWCRRWGGGARETAPNTSSG